MLADAVRAFPEPGFGDDPGFPSGFIALFVIVALVGVGTAIYKIWWTGELARRRGHDPTEARITGFLTGDLGTAATYLRPDREPDRPETRAAAAERLAEAADESAEERLEEVADLLAKGLISEAEAAHKRAEILRDL